jgi:hypothetical protein
MSYTANAIKVVPVLQNQKLKPQNLNLNLQAHKA